MTKNSHQSAQNQSISIPATAAKLKAALLFGLIIFSMGLLGITSRSVDLIALIWPANAVMLGLLIRVPKFNSIHGWICAFIGFVAADLFTGSSLSRSIILTLGNLLGVAAALMVYKHLPSNTPKLEHPAAVFGLVLTSAIAAAASALVGAIWFSFSLRPDTIQVTSLWFVSEFISYTALLPVILTAPSAKFSAFFTKKQRSMAWLKPRYLWPVAALIFSCVMTVWIGGPGAIAFPMPALLWCGLVFPVFPTAVLTLLTGAFTFQPLSNELIPSQSGDQDELPMISLRIAIALLAIKPVMLSSIMQHRERLEQRLRHLAAHDSLTNIYNRTAFMEEAQRLTQFGQKTISVMMIDLDHFKSINDEYGHAAGDEVLVNAVQRLRSCTRQTDVLARFGGEEFALLIPDCAAEAAAQTAERIRQSIREPMSMKNGSSIVVTASMGVFTKPNVQTEDIETMLASADTLLYRAKEKGRDRVETAFGNIGANT